MDRLSDSIAINNAWLTGLLLIALIVGSFGVLLGGSLTLRWLFRTSRARVLISIGDWLVRRTRRVAMLASALSVLGCLGLLGWGILGEVDFQQWVDETTAEWTSETLQQFGKKLLIVAGIGVIFWYLSQARNTLMPRIRARVGRFELLKEHEGAVADVIGELPDLLSLIFIYIVAGMAGRALEFSEWVDWTVMTVCFIALVANAAQLIAQAGRLALTIFVGYASRFADTAAVKPYYERVELLVPLANRVIDAVVYLSAVTLIVGRFETLELIAPFGSVAIQLVAVFFLGRVFVEVVGVLVYELFTRGLEDDAETDDIVQDVKRDERRARQETLAKLVQSLARFLIYIGMVMVMLIVVGVDPLPLIAGMGIVGFAVGLGSQKIMQDIICGFFMLMEDQMLIGDYVKVGDTEGIVEQLHLRVSRIRDRYGRVHTVCNGDVGNVVNYSRGWTLAVVEMSVAYEADLPTVLDVMTKVGQELHKQLPKEVLEPSQIMGVEAMDESCLKVRTETKVRPGCHYDVKRLLNRLLFEAFVDNGIEIPYPKGVEFDGVPPMTPPRPKRAPATN